MSPRFIISVAVLCMPLFSLQAQDTDSIAESDLPLLQLPGPDLVPVPPKIKPPPRNMFFGLRAKRKKIRSKQGKFKIKETFYHLRKKHAEEIPPYVPYVYWYSRSQRKIMYTSQEAPRDGPLLHGKYIRKWKKIILEERYYYHGTPHGKWVWRNGHNILLDKRYYFKGWSKDNQISYYDIEKTKIREVIPMQYEKRSGPYYAFHSNGQIAVKGFYKLDKRVNTWREYYSNGRPKRDLQYPKKPLDQAPSYITKEWGLGGNIIYAMKKKRK